MREPSGGRWRSFPVPSGTPDQPPQITEMSGKGRHPVEDGLIGRRSRPLPIDKNDLPPNVIDQIKVVVDRVWRRLLDAALDGLRHLEPRSPAGPLRIYVPRSHVGTSGVDPPRHNSPVNTETVTGIISAVATTATGLLAWQAARSANKAAHESAQVVKDADRDRR